MFSTDWSLGHFSNFKDTFFHVPIAKGHRRYLSFRFGNCYFRFRAPPFGLATSPTSSPDLVKVVGTFSRAQSLSLLQYLDSWNILAPSAQACADWTSWLLNLSKRLGLIINLTMQVEPSAVQTLRVCRDRLRSEGRHSQIGATLGPESSAYAADFLCVQGITGRQMVAATGPYDITGEIDTTGPSTHAPPTICFSPQLGPVNGSPVHPGRRDTGSTSGIPVVGTSLSSTTGDSPGHSRPEMQLFTDASTEGRGAHLTTHQTSGLWSTSQKALYINNLELLAVHLAVQHFRLLVIGKAVVVMTDMTVVGQIKSQGGTHLHS